MTSPCSRKDFLRLVAGSGTLALFGCSADPETGIPLTTGAGAAGGAGGSPGGAGTQSGAGTSGTSGTSGSGAAGSGSGATGGAGGAGGAGATGGSSGTGGSVAGGGQSGGAAGGSAGTGQGGRVGAGGAPGGGTGAGGRGAGGRVGTSGGPGAGGSGGGNACAAQITGTISMNHGHSLMVPLADITAGVAKVYNLRGTATHDHFVEVSAADFTTLKSGGTVKKVACNGGDHEVVLSCGTPSETAGNPACVTTDMCASAMNMLCPDPV